MGDRCYLRVETLQAHRNEFEDQAEGPGMGLDDETESTATFEECEANYGYASDLLRLAVRGVVFIAHQGAGSEYGAAVMVGDGDRKWAIDADFDQNPVVTLDMATGDPYPAALAAAREFAAAYRRTRAVLDGTVPHPLACPDCEATGDATRGGLDVFMPLPSGMRSSKTCGRCAGSGIALRTVYRCASFMCGGIHLTPAEVCTRPGEVSE